MKKRIVLTVSVLFCFAAVIMSCNSGFFGTVDDLREKSGGGGIKYTVTFKGNGGIPEAVTRTVKEGNKVSPPSSPPSLSGQTFFRWCEDAAGNDIYNFDTPVTQDITLYADWVLAGLSPCYVEFDSAPGTAVAPQTVYPGKKVMYPTMPYNRGYIVANWHRNPGLTDLFDFNVHTPPPVPTMTLYAQWVEPLGDVPGADLTEKFAWLDKNVLSGRTYTVKVTAAEEELKPQNLSYTDYTPATIKLENVNTVEKIISLSGNGSLFRVGEDVTLDLGDAITLKGHANNSAALVHVGYGGKLLTHSAFTKITGNTNSGTFGGGVYVEAGEFIMNGAEISGNTAGYGGGVYVSNYGTTRGSFTIGGVAGIVTGTARSYGGGVYIATGTGQLQVATPMDRASFTKAAHAPGTTVGGKVQNGSTVYTERGNAVYSPAVARISGFPADLRSARYRDAVGQLDALSSTSADGWTLVE